MVDAVIRTLLRDRLSASLQDADSAELVAEALGGALTDLLGDLEGTTSDALWELWRSDRGRAGLAWLRGLESVYYNLHGALRPDQELEEYDPELFYETVDAPPTEAEEREWLILCSRRGYDDPLSIKVDGVTLREDFALITQISPSDSRFTVRQAWDRISARRVSPVVEHLRREREEQGLPVLPPTRAELRSLLRRPRTWRRPPSSFPRRAHTRRHGHHRRGHRQRGRQRARAPAGGGDPPPRRAAGGSRRRPSHARSNALLGAAS